MNQEYRDYLQSSTWREKKDHVKSIQGNICSICKSPARINIHHLNYNNVGNEQASDLVVLCRSCHKKIHHGDLIGAIASTKTRAQNKAIKKKLKDIDKQKNRQEKAARSIRAQNSRSNSNTMHTPARTPEQQMRAPRPHQETATVGG